MSTPENNPEVPEPPRYGQRLPQPGQDGSGQGAGQQGQQPAQQPGQPQQGGAAGSYPPAPPQSYGQPGQPPAAQPGQYGQPGAYGQAGQQGQSGPYGQPGQGAPYGQPGQQSYGYQQPMPGSAGFGAPAGPLERPKELNISFWLVLAAGALTLVSGLVLLLMPSSALETAIQDALTMQGSATQDELAAAGVDAAALASMTRTVGFVVMLIGSGIYALLAFFIRKGSNGARITATILAGLSVIGLFGADVLTLVVILVGIAGVVFAWLKPSSNYIAAKKAAKHQGFGA
ncbi:hypothetical protein ACQ3I4_05350 [Zafaria sp. Z1313]|uniref:hypothetical protein n=1 Tax=unclassified Zafaria TaxID=2828765 RepID=UPI002E761776|nr:hypothetical protein [Zafaria sp. J156]MEE1621322.1 hypothetical protein [Zafaria sp. J156]